jgi:hypothetical protein
MHGVQLAVHLLVNIWLDTAPAGPSVDFSSSQAQQVVNDNVKGAFFALMGVLALACIWKRQLLGLAGVALIGAIGSLFIFSPATIVAVGGALVRLWVH